MKSEKLQDAIGMIGDDLILDAKSSDKTVKTQWVKRGVMAAVFVMAVVLIGVPLLRGDTPFIVNAIVNGSIKFPESGLKEDWEAVEPSHSGEGSGINVKGELAGDTDSGILPICYSEEYDAIYYVDYSNNKFIYRCKDNEVKLAVKIPADHLYMNGGELYFRVEEGTYDLKNMSAGDICKYSPVTGEIKKVIEGVASTWMTVSGGCIYYETEEAVFCYDLKEGVSEEINAVGDLVLWKDGYYVAPYSSSLQGRDDGFIGLGLHKIGTDYSTIKPVILEGRNNEYCVQGDVLYCTGIDFFNVVQLDTGEIQRYSYSRGGLGNFIVHNNRVYSSNLQFFIDLETGKSYELYGEISGNISRLFVINDKLYAMNYKTKRLNIFWSQVPEIVEVVVDEDPSLIQHEDVIYGEGFFFSFKEIGEE